MQNENIGLELFFTNAAGSKTAKIIDRYKLTSGAIQENWALDVEFSGGPLTGLQELCLRMDAPTRIGNSRSRIEEFALLKLAYARAIIFLQRQKDYWTSIFYNAPNTGSCRRPQSHTI